VAVASGAIVAHGAATGVAVIGRAAMNQYFSKKTIGYIGSSLFLIFALTTALGLLESVAFDIQ
jgi:putative Ca2+/H+ antiporter (TMEM165/GDT1 family)